MHSLNAGLVAAFPTFLCGHVLAALETFPEPEHPAAREFSVKVAGELVTIPYRLYHSPSHIKTEHLTDLEKEIVACLMTRHHDGFIRQQHLERIIRSGNPWVPPFVVQLLGEYAIEIIGVIHDNLNALDHSLYREFLQTNPEFFTQTAQRVEELLGPLSPRPSQGGVRRLQGFGVFQKPGCLSCRLIAARFTHRQEYKKLRNLQSRDCGTDENSPVRI